MYVKLGKLVKKILSVSGSLVSISKNVSTAILKIRHVSFCSAVQKIVTKNVESCFWAKSDYVIWMMQSPPRPWATEVVHPKLRLNVRVLFV